MVGSRTIWDGEKVIFNPALINHTYEKVSLTEFMLTNLKILTKYYACSCFLIIGYYKVVNFTVVIELLLTLDCSPKNF